MRCGSVLPRLAAILGRHRNVFTFSDGSQHSPWKWRSVFRSHLRAAQMQIVQTALDRIEIRYVPQDGAAPPDAAAIVELGRKAIHPSVTVETVAVAAIERHPSVKIQD